MGATPEQVRRGRRYLRDLLPSLRLEASRDEVTIASRSGLAEALMSFVTSEKVLDSLVVYPAPGGGWHADLVLKGIPREYGDTLGTPVGRPCATREDAEATGRETVVRVLRYIRSMQGRSRAPREPVFRLYNAEINLSAEMFQSLRQEMGPAIEAGYGSAEFATKRIEEVLNRVMPEGYSFEALQRLDQEGRARLTAVLHIASLSGLHRYPETAQSGTQPDRP